MLKKILQTLLQWQNGAHWGILKVVIQLDMPSDD